MTSIGSRQPVDAGERFPKKRSVPRYPIIAMVEVIEPVGRVKVGGWTSTISDSGCHVRAAGALKAGSIVQVQIEREGKIFQSWARVATSLPEEGMGLAFFDTDPAQRETLRVWMEEFETTKAT